MMSHLSHVTKDYNLHSPPLPPAPCSNCMKPSAPPPAPPDLLVNPGMIKLLEILALLQLLHPLYLRSSWWLHPCQSLHHHQHHHCLLLLRQTWGITTLPMVTNLPTDLMIPITPLRRAGSRPLVCACSSSASPPPDWTMETTFWTLSSCLPGCHSEQRR